MQIYIAKSGQKAGPFSEQQLESMLNSGMVSLTDSAWHEGLSEWLPLHQVLNVSPPVPQLPPIPAIRTTAAISSPPSNSGAMFLYIPTGRLIAMSIVSFGLYDAYWIYRNWRYLKERDGLKIQPFWRGIFGVFFIHSLLKAIKTDPTPSGVAPAKFSPGGLSTGWITLKFIGHVFNRTHDPAVDLIGIIISAPTFCFLLPAQNHINAMNEALPVRPAYYGFSGGHIVCLVIGIIAWLLTLIGLAA